MILVSQLKDWIRYFDFTAKFKSTKPKVTKMKGLLYYLNHLC